MENWGTDRYDNFASQDAQTYLDTLALQLVSRISEIFADEERLELDEDGEGMFMPSIDLLALLCERSGATPPKPDTVEQWRETYLRIYDRDIDRLADNETFRVERRKVIERTFTWLMGIAEASWQ